MLSGSSASAADEEQRSASVCADVVCKQTESGPGGGGVREHYPLRASQKSDKHAHTAARRTYKGRRSIDPFAACWREDAVRALPDRALFSPLARAPPRSIHIIAGKKAATINGARTALEE